MQKKYINKLLQKIDVTRGLRWIEMDACRQRHDGGGGGGGGGVVMMVMMMVVVLVGCKLYIISPFFPSSFSFFILLHKLT